MFRGVGSTWGDNFYMGTQNGSKLEIWRRGILIHTLELKLRPFEVTPYVCIGSHAFAMNPVMRTKPTAQINPIVTDFCTAWCVRTSRAQVLEARGLVIGMADKFDIDASQSEDESYSDREVDVPVLPKSADPSCCATGPKKTVICVFI